MRRWLTDALIALFFLAFPLGFFAPQTLGDRTLLPTENLYQYEPFATYADTVKAPTPHNHLLSDMVLQNYGWKHFLREQLSMGEVPLWNPYLFSGVPFLAAGQHSGLYPLSVLYYALDLPSAYGWFIVVNLWLAGALTYAFLRGLGVGRAGATLGGVVYQLNGFVLASVVFPMMIGGLVWLPLLLWMIERVLAGRSSRLLNVCVGSVGIGLNVLAGHAEITIYTLLISGYYAFCRLAWGVWQARQWRDAFGKGAWLLAMVALGLGLGAIQLIPLYDFVQTNWRAERASLETVRSYAHPIRDLLQFLMPNFYGNPSHHHVWNAFTGETVALTQPQTHTEWGIKNYVEGALYVGILPLLLSLYTLFSTGQRQLKLIFALLGGASLSFMFGAPTYALIYALPGINQLNSPFRWVYALALCVAVLSALGLDDLGRGGKWARRAGWLALGVGLGVGTGIIGVRLLYPTFAPLVQSAFESLTGASGAFPNAELFFSYQAVNALIFAGVLGLSGVLFLWRARAPHSTRWQWLAVALVAGDLMIATRGFNPASDPALLKFTPPVIAWLQGKQPQDFRITTLDDPAHRPILQANSLQAYGIADVRGYDSIIPKPYVDYMRATAPQVQLDYNRIAPLYTSYPSGIAYDSQAGAQDARLRYLAVRFVVTHKHVSLPSESFTLAYEDEAVRVWERLNAFPLAYVCCDGERATAYAQALADGTFIEDADGLYNAITPILPARNSGREKTYTVEAGEGRWLVISENHNDGWRAFVRATGTSDDETLLPVVRVNERFQGVRLPAGNWVVRLVYSPPSFQVGLFASVMSVGIITLALGMWLWGRFVGTNNAQSSATARVARNSLAPILLNLFNRGVDFAFLLVMLRLLSPQDVGVYNYLVVLFVWFDTFTNFGLNLFLIREISRDRTRAVTLFYQSSLLRMGLVVVGVGLACGYIGLRQATVTPPLDATALLTFALLYVGLFPSNLSQGMSALFYAHEQAEKPSAIQTITTMNKAIFGVVVLLLGWGIVGLAAVSIVNNLLTFAVLVWSGRDLLKGWQWQGANLPMFGEMVRGSWALLLNNFLAIIFFQVDIVILEALKGAGVVARYSVAYKWLSAINVVPSFFTQALLPLMSRQAHADKGAYERTYRLGVKLLFTLALPVAVSFTWLAEPLTLFMGGEQYLPDGALAVQLMIWSIPIGWMNSLTQYALIALDMQRRITWAFVVAVTFNIVANMVFIPAYSFVAAAITTILSELTLFVFFAYLMQEGLGKRLNWAGLLWKPSASVLGMLGALLVLEALPLLLRLLLASVVYLVALLALKPLDAHEQGFLGERLPSRMRGLAVRVGLAR